MPRTEIPLTNGFYVSDSLPISHQECVNFIPVQQSVPVLSQRQLIGSAGIRQVATSGNDDSSEINRGSHVMAGEPYFVNGTTLYRLDRSFVDGNETFTMTQVGISPISIPGSIRVSMADNGYQLMILVPGDRAYIYDKDTDVMSQITTGIFSTTPTTATYVVFIDGYFAVSTSSKQWYVSALNDGTSWDILDFGSAESDPDDIVAPVVHNNQIFMTGSETTEGFQNIGGAGFPFQRSNLFLDKGCYAPFTLVSTNQRFFMVGGGTNERAAIWSYQDGNYVKISTNAIDNILNNYSDTQLSASFSLAWANRGQYFVAFTFPDRTLVFNMSTSLWHEQKSGIDNEAGDPEQTRWRVNSLATAYGYVFVGDNQDGRIGILDIDQYTEYGENIVRVFSTQPLANQGKSFRLAQVELTMEAGVGNGVAEPIVSMAISEDLKTFQYERSRKIGAIGKYGQRTIWRKLGRVPRFCLFKFRVSDQIKPVVIKLEADIL